MNMLGTGYPTVPGIYTQAQIAAWKKVVDAIHAQGSFVFLQLWALGRAADAECLKKDGFEVVSSSDLTFEGGATPRPLTEAEIGEYVKDYAAAAKAFIEEAGGDGVESESGAPVGRVRARADQVWGAGLQFTEPTDISLTSLLSSTPTSGPTATAVQWRTAAGSAWRSPRRSPPWWASPRSAFACRPSPTSRV